MINCVIIKKLIFALELKQRIIVHYFMFTAKFKKSNENIPDIKDVFSIKIREDEDNIHSMKEAVDRFHELMCEYIRDLNEYLAGNALYAEPD